MNATINRLTAATLGAAAITAGALAVSAPAISKPLPVVTSMQQTCEQRPELYATGAVRGVFSTQRQGDDRVQICKTYDAAGKHLGTNYAHDYGYYTFRVESVPNAPLSPR